MKPVSDKDEGLAKQMIRRNEAVRRQRLAELNEEVDLFSEAERLERLERERDRLLRGWDKERLLVFPRVVHAIVIELLELRRRVAELEGESK